MLREVLHVAELFGGGGKPKPAGEVERTPLNRVERVMRTTGQLPVTTITFFRKLPGGAGGPSVETELRERVAAVLAANPWLAGHVTMTELVWEKAPPPSAVDRVFVTRAACDLGPQTPYREMYKLCKDAEASLLGVGKPAFLVTLLPAAAPEGPGFALVVSLAHILGDGHTYYQLWNMLTNAARVEALSASRKLEADAGMEAKIEHSIATDWVFAANFMFGLAAGKLRSLAAALPFVRPPSPFALRFRYLDVDFVARAKAKAKAGGEVPFVSTNDVVTSWFLKAFPVGTMAINFRNRLAGLGDNDAGN